MATPFLRSTRSPRSPEPWSLPLSQFFAEPNHSNGSKGLPQLSDDEVRFLSQIRHYSTSLNDSDRKLVLAMVKKMASNASK